MDTWEVRRREEKNLLYESESCCKRVPVSIYQLSVSITVTAAVSGLACFIQSRFGPQLWVRPQLRTNQSGAPLAGDRGRYSRARGQQDG